MQNRFASPSQSEQNRFENSGQIVLKRLPVLVRMCVKQILRNYICTTYVAGVCKYCKFESEQIS